jgi:hypothetical protein
MEWFHSTDRETPAEHKTATPKKRNEAENKIEKYRMAKTDGNAG